MTGKCPLWSNCQSHWARGEWGVVKQCTEIVCCTWICFCFAYFVFLYMSLQSIWSWVRLFCDYDKERRKCCFGKLFLWNLALQSNSILSWRLQKFLLHSVGFRRANFPFSLPMLFGLSTNSPSLSKLLACWLAEFVERPPRTGVDSGFDPSTGTNCLTTLKLSLQREIWISL